jgi:hypothetical protein
VDTIAAQYEVRAKTIVYYKQYGIKKLAELRVVGNT